MITQAIVLCGGKGERLGDIKRYTPAITIPKPLIEVGGKPFIMYSITMLKGIGFEDIVLLAREKASSFEYLSDKVVRVLESTGHINEEVLSIPNLSGMFLLLNSDSFPLMDWRVFCKTNKPRVALKVIGRDAGVAIVDRQDIIDGRINCSDIASMMNMYENYVVLGGLHIGTPQGLHRARMFIDMAVYGQ